MKKFLPILLLLALPLNAGTLTTTTTAPLDTHVAKAMARANKTVCLYYSQGVGCTQAQARKEFCRRAGFGGVTTCDNAVPPVCTTTPLTASCDGANQVDVFADVATYWQSVSVEFIRDTMQTRNLADDAAAFEAAKASANQAAKDAACAALGLAAGCLP